MSSGSSTPEATTPIPTLPETHSGIPPYLLPKATRAKEAVFSGRTKPAKPRSREVPVVPQGVSRDQFLEALEELKRELGEENVEVNDKPLKDGWYMEHPNTHDMMTILDEEEFVAGAVVYPGNTDEVVKIVKWANRWLVPIFPISMGRNRKFSQPNNHGGVGADENSGLWRRRSASEGFGHG